MKATENHIAQDEFLFFSLLFFVFVFVIVFFSLLIYRFLTFPLSGLMKEHERSARKPFGQRSD